MWVNFGGRFFVDISPLLESKTRFALIPSVLILPTTDQEPKGMKIFAVSSFLFLFAYVASASAQDNLDAVTVRAAKASGNVYFLDCTGGFGGGNVAASIGDDGILLVDDMYAAMGPKLLATLKTLSDKPVRIVLNTHFHGDHIQGNKNFHGTAVIIGQENIAKRLIAANKDWRRHLITFRQ